MSLSERKESIIAHLASIDKQRLIMAKEAEKTVIASKEEEAKRKEAEINRNALIEKSWNELKPLISNSLKDINESMLNNSGKLLDWKRSNETHQHKWKVWSQDDNDYFDMEENHSLDVEFAGLKIEKGIIFIERIFSSCDHYGKYDFKEKNPSEFYIRFGNSPDFNKKLKKFSLVFNENEIQPLIDSIEDTVLDFIVKHY